MLSANATRGFYTANRLTSGTDLIALYDTIGINAIPPEVKASLHLPVVSPKPGAKLSYTQIMFEHAQVTGAEKYLLEVALDDSSNSFAHPIFKLVDSSLAGMLGNFEFGKKYIWRYTGLHNNTQLGWQGPYNFEILKNNCVDKNQYRVNVHKNDHGANTGSLIMLDMARCIDRNGNFVWFLSDLADVGSNAATFFTPPMSIEDLRITPFGTITLINGVSPEEYDLAGNLLWRAPEHNDFDEPVDNKPRIFAYHHCFKRLNNGNYMVLDQNTFFRTDLTDHKAMVAYEIIKEFNPAGNVVWSWSSKNYFNKEELKAMVLDVPDPFLNNRLAGGHMNAFDVDEKNGFVYAGFRNISRVIKIDKKSGAVVCVWGDSMSYHGAPNGYGFFSKQHGATLLHDGSIAVFNNNVPVAKTATENDRVSEIVIFTQPTDSANSRITFKYDCSFPATRNLSKTGGNVDELENGNLLVCMGETNRIFEITRNKKIVWSATIEKNENFDSTWRNFAVYRAHYTSSLYPCYFTVQTTGTGIKIFNDGSEDDSYQISVSSATGNYKKPIATSQLHTKKSVIINIPGADDTVVTITSKTNPAFKRVISIK